jgi:Lanthionine synthetase C-like protein
VLYRADLFEPLESLTWRETRVRDAIAEIVADADGAFDSVSLWPADDWDAWRSPLPLKTLYTGAAGVIWALNRLRARGFADSRLDLEHAARRALEAWRDEPGVLTGLELPEPAAASLLMGETGILTVLWQLTHDRLVADDLHELVLDNAANLARELMWGAPGTMLAAQALLDATGDERWATAWSRSASALLASRDADGLWTQRLHGEESRGLGPPHGLVGIVAALLQGAALLPNAELRSLRERTAGILRDTAVLEDGLANWPMAAGEPLLAGDGQVRLQWDCGAPGIVTSAASYLDEELLLAAAALVSQAGPHGPEKGSGICHGTAGNGYALLEVFERTQDEHWLERARRFAVHALAQVERARAGRGRGRYSLWTGDVGVALFAADCLDGRARYPVLTGWG